MALLEKIFDWLTQVLPGLIGSYILGFKQGQSKMHELEKELTLEEVAKQQLANKIFVDEKYSGMDDNSVIKSAIAGTKPDGSNDPGKPKPDGE